jgi:hypothetical protein
MLPASDLTTWGGPMGVAYGPPHGTVNPIEERPVFEVASDLPPMGGLPLHSMGGPAGGLRMRRK